MPMSFKIMHLSMPSSTLSDYIKHLLSLYFPDGQTVSFSQSDFSLALERCEYSFSRIRKNSIKMIMALYSTI